MAVRETLTINGVTVTRIVESVYGTCRRCKNGSYRSIHLGICTPCGMFLRGWLTLCDPLASGELSIVSGGSLSITQDLKE